MNKKFYEASIMIMPILVTLYMKSLEDPQKQMDEITLDYGVLNMSILKDTLIF